MKCFNYDTLKHTQESEAHKSLGTLKAKVLFLPIGVNGRHTALLPQVVKSLGTS